MKTLTTLSLTAVTMLFAGSFTRTADAGQGTCHSQYPRYAPVYVYCPPPCPTPPEYSVGNECVDEGAGSVDDEFGDDEGFEEESDLSALVGLWEAVSTDGNGQRQQILMNVRTDGTAQLKVPNGRGGSRTITGGVAVAGGNLQLSSGGRKMSLGQVVTANAQLVVLKNRGGNIVFRRP